MPEGSFQSPPGSVPASQANNDSGFEAALGAVLNKYMNKGNPQFRARLLNQMVQLARHGNFAETFIRTTPEGTDMVNFARLWEYVLVQADRATRGYVAKNTRGDFELTRKDFQDCIEFMVTRLQSSSKRHKLDLSGTNFISRVAQRYGIADKVRKGPAQTPPRVPAANPVAASHAEQPVAMAMNPEELAPAKAKRPTRAKEAALPDVDAL